MKPMIFDGVKIEMITRDGEVWARGSQIGEALGYKSPDVKIRNLYKRHADEFTDSMTGVIEYQTAGGIQKVRVFSLRGAHLLGMFARTDKAKSFRRWILDILDALHRGAEYVRQKRDEAERLLEDRRQQASSDGKGLSSWRWDKQPLQMSVEYWKERQQLCLEFL